MFHALRRQQEYNFRKPMIVFTPKSLLRDPLCVSSVDEFTTGCFQEIIDDKDNNAKKTKKVILCTGKVYYDLKRHKDDNKREDVSLIRLEQLYPMPMKQLKDIISKYKGSEFLWVQEEPENMGYWSYLLSRYPDIFVNFGLVSRPLSATPATGFSKVHVKEQQDIIKKSFE
jgi:2-oxoglutarate dehydrogenase E1 component